GRAVSRKKFDRAKNQTGRGFFTLNPNKMKLGINYYEKSSFSLSPLPPASLLPNFSTENETALLSKGGAKTPSVAQQT
ncbi:MAG TPA: hypothetical protein DDW51_15900, partial [Cyanobacteria bacterium UBA11367]|nr:hypothetical protein [Cyanobacteria bacterium UBA11367]